MNKTADKSCPSCGSTELFSFYEVGNVPVHSVLNMQTREMAVNYPKGDISLGFCGECGFITNVDFDSHKVQYSGNCEESQGFSPTFNAFAHRLAIRLIERYDLHNKDIIEIGCGKGEFLTQLCELGNNRGLGFDPAYVDGRLESEALERVTFIKDYYTEKYAGHKADFICCKMTLEHIQDIAEFIGRIRHSIAQRSGTIVFFQVPDVTRILRDCAFEDIYYEHCSYFSPGSLARLFRKCGFNVLRLEADYDGQYLMIEAKPANGGFPTHLPQENDLEKLRDSVGSFHEKLGKKLSLWKKQLHNFNVKNRRVVLWGAGSKGVAFLTTLKIHKDIKYVVDINPYRQGTYMAGTGQEIVSPDFLKKYLPDIVIIMNSVYRDEIKRNLGSMGLAPGLLTL